MSDASRTVALARIGRVVTDLDEISERLVFIGGAVLPLLVDIEQRFDDPRVTKDVDAISATASYTAQGRIEEALRRARYRHGPESHIGRFISPTNEIFDISFAGDHAGGTGSNVDALAIETAVTHAGPPPFRHISATGFMLMKVAAYFDRGDGAPYESKDLADLAVLLVASPGLVKAVEAQRSEVRTAVVAAARRLRSRLDLGEFLRSHLRDRRPILPDSPDSLAQEAVERLIALS